ncbi:hypothetical protein ACFL5Q_07145 [Planctomycetota bacterium]
MSGDIQGAPTDKEKADVYLELANRATRRFEAVRNVAWKVNLGTWTFFVAGTAVTLNSSYANVGPAPVWIATVLTTIVALTVAVAHTFAWLPYIHEVHSRDGKASFWWECMTRIQIGEAERLPFRLEAPPDWPRPVPLPSEGDPNDYFRKTWLRKRVSKAARWMRINEAHVVWSCITWAFALLLVCTLVAKAIETSASAAPSSGPTVTNAQLKLEVDAQLKPTDQQGK